MTVYADVLFLVNFMVNFLVLYLTGKIAHLKRHGKMLVLGACAGALYAVLMFFPRLSFGYSAAAKVLFSLFVVALTFQIRGVRLFLKTVGAFYLVTFALGGSVMALFYFTDVGARLGAVVKNGIFYVNLPLPTLLLAVGISYLLLCVGLRILQNRLTRDNLYRKVAITWNGKEVWLDALLDTGNALCEPFSGAPVIIAEYAHLLPILPQELQNMGEDSTLPLENVDAPYKSRLRMIPFSSLGKEHGMLLGFRPDSAKLLVNEKLFDAGDVIVGIYTKKLAPDRSYAALLPPRILSQEYI